ncbi:hypothetical protein LAZ67_15002329 [Cordylochernes scorpioides]|uniref:Uncharacterized protein n=1 Tax=Cordylochernes scorpioides TaxID=51811 RepID=A0ABY6LBJ3_9ARAC|nr:hypothetical protein LAZ67_15002329 [Cordylochernes scorpioides]
MLTVAYGEATLDRSNVYRCYKMFSEGREDVNDEERAGRLSTSTTDEKINEVEKMILANRRITVREVAEDLNISIGSCHSIFINDLGMRRVAAKFVPKLPNCDQKQHRMNIANEMLDSVRDDPNLLQRAITGDEAWVYGYDVETKAQSSQWKLPHEPRPKKSAKGVVHHEFLPQGRTVNKEYYLQVMRNLREAICQKRPDLWKNKNWLLHHDNAPAHTSLLVRDFLAKNNALMMPQPPYSPDLAPCDFFLFPKLKRPMKGRRYATLDEIKTASKEELKKILKNYFLKCFEEWKNRCHKAVIKFNAKLGRSASETYILMKQVYGTLCLSKSNVFIWHKRFSDGRNTLEDDKHTGRPSYSKTPESIEKVREFVANNRSASLRMMAEVLHINKETIRTILHEDLGKTKVCAKFVPHTLTGEQKSLRIAHCRDIISAYENDSNFLKSIVTGDETWCFQNNPKTKCQMPAHTRVIRSCAKSMREQNGSCYRKGHTSFRMTYCECVTDGCNSAGRVALTLGLLLLALVFLFSF